MGPFADRVDMHIKVTAVSKDSLELARKDTSGLSSRQMREIVQRTRQIQAERYHGTGYLDNGMLDDNGIKRFCRLDTDSLELMHAAYDKMNLTMRGYKKILKIARTIADVDGSDQIKQFHVAEALLYRVNMEE